MKRRLEAAKQLLGVAEVDISGMPGFDPEEMEKTIDVDVYDELMSVQEIYDKAAASEDGREVLQEVEGTVMIAIHRGGKSVRVKVGSERAAEIAVKTIEGWDAAAVPTVELQIAVKGK